MSCPSTPAVLNGKITNLTSTTAEFECLQGFYMTGSKIINCTTSGWQPTPTCDVIRTYSDVTVFPSWWFYVLAAILGCLVLACLLCIFCWWCCGRPSSSVGPYERYSTGPGCCACDNGCGVWCTGSRGCCRGRTTDLSDTEEGRRYHTIRSPADNGAVYFLPSHRVVEGSGGLYVYGARGLSRIHVKDQATSTEKKERNAINEPHQTSHVASYVDHVNAANEASPVNGTAPSNTWHKNHRESLAWSKGYREPYDSGHRKSNSDKGHRDSKAWKDMANSETRSDGELADHAPQSKKAAKEVKAWMPHSNPVRNNHNTSTK